MKNNLPIYCKNRENWKLQLSHVLFSRVVSKVVALNQLSEKKPE